MIADRRGVSEALGFVLAFALIMSTVGIVYATGLTGLEESQQAEQKQNMERAFDVLHDNLEDMHRTGVPSRATELRLAGGSLSTDERTDVTIYAENTSDSADNVTFGISPRPIGYTSPDGNTRILYENGALIRSDRGDSVMFEEPNWMHVTRSERNTTVIPFITTYRGDDTVSTSGTGTVLVVSKQRVHGLRGQFEVDPGHTMEVTITIESPYAESWNRFLSDQGYAAIDDDPSNGIVEYRFETEKLLVPRTGIDIEFRH